MSTNRWKTLSDWHNEWLEADAPERDRLRVELAAREPELVPDADALTAASDRLGTFLETPAFMLAVPDLASDVSLDIGTMLGPYRITGPLASGGMGDVYRATDVRLDRNVAVKVLTRASEGDPDRRERFLQEARLTAQLDHPNVVRLYDVGVSSGRPYLVTELLEGETLRARLERGPVPIAEVLVIAGDIARGLVAAHAARLVHRDLKPENVFLTRAGIAKVLDFGIAKLKQDPTRSNTEETMTGVLFGTAGYLAPEQVRGLAVDARTDLFTLGAIVFEMLHGRRAFAREHTIDTLHAIVHEPPIEPAEVRSDAPAALQAIVSRLLQKAPADRFQSAEEVLEALGRVEAGGREAGLAISPRMILAIIATVVVAVGAIWLVATRTDLLSSWSGPARSTWRLPSGMALASSPALSPDGTKLALAATTGTGTVLAVRELGATDAQTITGTEGARQPFWSPDSRSIGYFARGRLLRVELAGGAPVVVANAQDAMGGAWSPNGSIVFGRQQIDAPLFKVSIGGGAAEPATTLTRSAGDNSHRWPTFLPDGSHFVYFVRSADDQRRGVYLARVDKPAESKMLFSSDSPAVYVPVSRNTGVLLAERSGKVEAREFDHEKLSLVGDPRFIDVAVGGATLQQAAMLSASSSALAVVATPMPFGDRLMEVQRDGKVLRTWPEREAQNWTRISPDGRWLLRQRIDPLRGNPDIWAEHLELRTRVRVTTDPDDEAFAVWSPTGKEVAYVTGHRSATPRLHVTAADGTGSRRELRCPGVLCRPTDWTLDGRFLVGTVHYKNGKDVWLIAATSAGSSRPLLSQSFVERDARMSPDGRWVAYVSEETGRAEVSIRRAGASTRRVVVSADGGDQPVWRRDGSELFFVDPEGRLMVARMQTSVDTEPLRGAPAALPVPRVGFGHFGTQYDASPDGQRFYFLDRRREPAPSEIQVVTGWQRLLRRPQ